MSIFSRLRRRGEDGGAPESPPSSAPPSAPAPKAPPAPAPPAPSRATEAAKPPGARRRKRFLLRRVSRCARPPPARRRAATSRLPSPGRSGTRRRRPTPARPVVSSKPLPPTAASPFPTPSRPPTAVIRTDGRLARSRDRPRARRQRRRRQARPAATPGSGTLALIRVRRRRAARDVRGSRRCARDADPQRDDGGPLGRGADELARARTPGAEVAAVDGVGGRPLGAGRGARRFRRRAAEVLEPGQPPDLTGPSRDSLLTAYAPLASCLPHAFALEGERDRREPIIVRALLEQVGGLEPLMIDKLMAAGLGTLPPLFAAKADELAAVSGIPDAVATAVAARIQAFRRTNPGALAAVDPRLDDPRAPEAARAAPGRARGVRGGLARLDGGRSPGEEAAPRAAPDDLPPDHDRAGAPRRDRLRAAPAEAAIRAPPRRSRSDRRQPRRGLRLQPAAEPEPEPSAAPNAGLHGGPHPAAA